MIQLNGNPAYVRDGKVYEGGIFGGDIVEAVRGNPEAESHARAYKNGMIGGFLSTLAGGASMIGGLTLFALGSQSDTLGRDHNPTEQTAGGLVLMLNAQPRMWDAINVYNDGIPMGPTPYGYPPPGAYPYPPPPPASWHAPPPGTPTAPPAPTR
jgi:hypothetical protein